MLQYLRCGCCATRNMPTALMQQQLRLAGDWRRTNYGGVAQYLEHIGFGEKEQERLRLSLSSS